MTMHDDGTVNPLMREIEILLARDIPDRERRRMLSAMVLAHMRVAVVHALRERFDPYIGMDGELPTPEQAVEAMRAAIVAASSIDGGP